MTSVDLMIEEYSKLPIDVLTAIVILRTGDPLPVDLEARLMVEGYDPAALRAVHAR